MEETTLSDTIKRHIGAVSPQGQLVIVLARWILVLAGFSLALWNPAPMGELRVQLATLLGLAVANFFLHAQLLRRKPVVDSIAYISSGADVAVITAIVIAQGGYASHLYGFYCVALLAMAVAFPLVPVILYTSITAGFYGLIALATVPSPTSDAHLLDVLCRVVILVAVAACGQLYRHIEQRHQTGGVGDSTRRALALENKRDVFFGQVVLIWARWAVIGAGAVMALWLSESSEALTLNILPVVVLMGINFYLHARYLLEKPANQLLVTLLSVLDLAMVTAIVIGWDVEGAGRGLANPFYVYYYPLLLAFGFVFPPRLTAAFTAGVLAAYATACIGLDPTMVADPGTLKDLTVRLITLGATGALGTYYYRLQRRADTGDRGPGGRTSEVSEALDDSLGGLGGAQRPPSGVRGSAPAAA